MMSSWFMTGSVPLWLVAALVIQLLWLAFGQVRRMRIALSGESLHSVGTSSETQAPVTDWMYWFRQFVVFGLILGLAFGGQVAWLMAEYELPVNLAWKRPLQRMGVLSVPLPEMVAIPAGKFDMGQRKAIVPPHEVTIDYSFKMGKYEVTFDEFDHFVVAMREAGIPFKNGPEADTVTPYPFPEDEDWGRKNRPVINVSWYQAQDYVNWLSHETGLQCRLPSESEWEYTARAGTDTVYWWGDEASHEYANYGKDECCDGLIEGRDQWENTAPVGAFPANPFGLLDMHGNVLEWVQDYYGDYTEAPVDGTARESAECASRVLRGGSWGLTPNLLRSSIRGWYSPDVRVVSIGFRIVCPPIEH